MSYSRSSCLSVGRAVELHEDVGQGHLALALDEASNPTDLLSAQIDLEGTEPLAVERVLHHLAHIPLWTTLLVGHLGQVDVGVLTRPGRLAALLLSLPLSETVLVDEGPFLVGLVCHHLALGLVREVVPAALLHQGKKHLLNHVFVVRLGEVESIATLDARGELG
jgi:hypothetical protein